MDCGQSLILLSREAFQSDGYRFMATSDIAAYYENIQLDILRDQLAGYLHQEPKIVNLFYTAFSAWTYDTVQGRRYLRGIPQGSQISAFFGNIFLKPIDDAFVALRHSHDIKYFRYMDDIRIFTKTFGDARKAIMVLDAEIRRLHLNLQSAKTRIYSEDEGEISAALIDRRIAQAEAIGDEISLRDKDARKAKRAPDYNGLTTMLDRISNENPDAPDEQRIRHARKPLKGLSDRVFRRLLTLHIRIGSDEIVDRLLTEITRNSDYRLGLKLIQFARHFPRKLSIQNRLMKLLRDGEIVFPSQEAQLIKALRYQSRVQPDTLKYMLERAADDAADPQIKVQAFQLLSRSKLSQEMVQTARVAFDDAEHTAVKMAATFV